MCLKFLRDCTSHFGFHCYRFNCGKLQRVNIDVGYINNKINIIRLGLMPKKDEVLL